MTGQVEGTQCRADKDAGKAVGGGKQSFAAGAEPVKTVEPLTEEQIAGLFCQPDMRRKQCRECEYPRSSTEVDNDSIKLWEAYEKMPEADKTRPDWRYEEVKKEFGKEKWSYTAHHIISGNQVLKPYTEIVRLANFYGYDINGAANGIILLTKHKNDDGEWAEKRSVSAYEAMSEGKIQWHLGGHSYKFTDTELQRLHQQIRLYTKKEANKIATYAELLREEIEKLQAALLQVKCCRQGGRQKAAFIRRMDRISAKIKEKLGAFSEKPHRSYPYYVSKEAYLYTFNVPRTAKLLVLYSTTEGFFAERWRATRFEETINDETGKGLDFKCRKKDNGLAEPPHYFDAAQENWPFELIEYAENTRFIVLLDEAAKQYIWPLTGSEQLILAGESGETAQRLRANDIKILVWLRDCLRENPDIYKSPLTVIRERMQDYDISLIEKEMHKDIDL